MRGILSKPAVRRALALAACLIAGSVAVYALWITPVRNTCYAPGYSEQAYRSISAGDSEGRVLDLLGEPLERSLNVYEGLPRTYLWYTRPAGPGESYLLRNVVIQDGRVTQVFAEIWRD